MKVSRIISLIDDFMDELISYAEEQQGQARASEASDTSCTASNEIMEMLRKIQET